MSFNFANALRLIRCRMRDDRYTLQPIENDHDLRTLIPQLIELGPDGKRYSICWDGEQWVNVVSYRRMEIGFRGMGSTRLISIKNPAPDYDEARTRHSMALGVAKGEGNRLNTFVETAMARGSTLYEIGLS